MGGRSELIESTVNVPWDSCHCLHSNSCFAFWGVRMTLFSSHIRHGIRMPQVMAFRENQKNGSAMPKAGAEYTEIES